MSLIAGHGSMPTGVSYTTRTKPILFGLTQEWSQRTHGTKRILPEIADTAVHRYSSIFDYRKVLVYEEGEIRRKRMGSVLDFALPARKVARFIGLPER